MKNLVALIQTPFWAVNSPPFAVASLTAFLRRRRHIVLPFDLNRDFCKGSNRIYYDLWKYLSYAYDLTDSRYILRCCYLYNKKFFDNWVEKIINTGARIVGFTIYQTTSLFSLVLAERLKKRNKNLVIIFGGPDCGRERKGFGYIKLSYVDIVVTGEGEKTLNEIVSDLKKGAWKKSYKGVLVKSNGTIVNDGGRPLIRNIGTLPFPDFTDFPPKEYPKAVIPVSFSRGCISRCSFCGETIFWKHFRHKTAKRMFKELLYLKNKYEYDLFCFVDSLLNGNLKELEELCDLIIKNKLDIRWFGLARIRKDTTLTLLKKMKRAGCSDLQYGIESGSQKVLDDMNKGYKLDVIEKVLKLTKKAGIRVLTFWIVGFPTESLTDFFQSLKFILKNKGNVGIVFSATPCTLTGGSDININYRRYGILSNKSKMFWNSRNVNFIARFFRYIFFKICVNLIYFMNLIFQ